MVLSGILSLGHLFAVFACFYDRKSIVLFQLCFYLKSISATGVSARNNVLTSRYYWPGSTVLLRGFDYAACFDLFLSNTAVSVFVYYEQFSVSVQKLQKFLKRSRTRTICSRFFFS